MSNSPFVFDVDESNFQTAVVDRSREVPVVIDFWAPWCGPCRALGPILERLVMARNGAVLLAKVNVDENPNLAADFEIQGIPAVKAIRDGRLVLQFEGLLPEPHVEAFLNQVCPSQADNQAREAAETEKTAPTEAEAVYAAILAQSPDHVAARLGMARMKLAAGHFAEVEPLLETIPPAGDDGAEAERIRAELELRRVSTGDEAVLRSRMDADPENAEPRYELGKVLAARGQYPEALEMLYTAAERDRALARGKVKETMVHIFHVIGTRSDLADEYRDKLRRVMY